MTFNVQILLSTYNGARYLREQLDCFLRQTGVKVSVLIRDDGSTDETTEILREYERNYGFKVIYGENIGVNASIFKLLQCADTSVDYYAISDQDDYWMDGKLSAGISMLELGEKNVPLLYGSRIEVVDEHLHHSFFSKLPKRGVSFFNAATQNILPGHTQIFNNTLRELVLRAPIDDVTVIDWWLYLIASGTGRVFYDSRTYVKHRQHGDNAVGYQKSGMNLFLMRLRRLRSGDANAISRQLYSFYLCFYPYIFRPYRDELDFYFRSLEHMPLRLRYVCSSKFYRQTRMDDFAFKILFLCGKYKLSPRSCI